MNIFPLIKEKYSFVVLGTLFTRVLGCEDKMRVDFLGIAQQPVKLGSNYNSPVFEITFCALS